MVAAREEWLKARQKGIGGSDAAAVLGISPWKSNVQLWEEKTGITEPEDISEKEVVRFGKESEAAIRQLFQLDFPEYKVSYDEFGMIANQPDCPFIFATLDGELTDQNGRKGILEIKTTEIRRSIDWKKWKGQVPDYYYAQIVHQLLATGYDFAILKARIREQRGALGEFGWSVTVRHYLFERSPLLEDIAYLKEKEIAFWRAVQTKTRPALILPEI